jgi:N-dimethylarginine dimethylaminohydrolase
MINLHISDETSPLQSVVLGTAEHMGPTPKPEEAYDPKSLENIVRGTYPEESTLTKEMDGFEKVLKKHGVEVLRPDILEDTHQVYARDIGFVIDDYFIVSNVLDDRKEEIHGIDHLLQHLDPDKILRLDESIRMEGGDVIPWKGKLYVGYSDEPDFLQHKVSRTNLAGVEFLRNAFPDYEVVAFELRKSDTVVRENALHLDCCFQPIGHNEAIVCANGFKNPSDVDILISHFGIEHIIQVDVEDMYNMATNVFSISPEVIVSEKSLTAFNERLRSRGYTIEEVAYAEVSKMGGLFRCSTLPLRRSHV